jgi:hypothetical protein
VGSTQIVDPACLEVAADSAGLDVDDLARGQRDRLRCRPGRGDGLIEADRGADDLCQLGVPEDVFLIEWLLYQQQPERIEPA